MFSESGRGPKSLRELPLGFPLHSADFEPIPSCHSFFVAKAGFGSMLQQEGRNLTAVELGGLHGRRVAYTTEGVDIRAVRHEGFDNSQMPAACGKVQRGSLVGVGKADI